MFTDPVTMFCTFLFLILKNILLAPIFLWDHYAPFGIRVLDIDEKKDDLISNLPEEILCHIVSLVPLRLAAQTSLLSTRWRNVWTKAFAVRGTIEDIVSVTIAFVNDPCKFYHPTDLCMVLPYQYHGYSILLCKLKWFSELHLDFCDEKHESPMKFDWHLNLHEQNVGDGPQTSRLHWVTRLSLSSLDYQTKQEIGSIISKFHVLKCLEIRKCSGLCTLCVEAGSKLKSLTILDCPDLSEIDISASGLVNFCFRGRLPMICLKNTDCIASAMLDLRGAPLCTPFSYENLLALLLMITNARDLTLSGWLSEVLVQEYLSSARVKEEHGELRFDKLNNLWWITNSMEKCRMDALVYFLKLCPSLQRLFVTVNPKSYCIPSDRDCCLWRDCSKQVASGPHQLQFAKLEGFADRRDEILITTFILKETASAKPAIVSISRRFGSRENCPQQLLKIPWEEGKKSVKGADKVLEEKAAAYCFRFVGPADDDFSRVRHPHMRF
ncbi:F-box domain [Dillenia turbinata]|uniref:F-box domain n=1 Tax=Dillenia turbinata TaxID=194707 RepID=A0AAN8V822_9MAGN